MTQSKVLVIGGSGFIGSNLLKGKSWTNIDLKKDVDVCDGIYDNYDVIVLLAAHLGFTRQDYIKNLKIYTALAEYLLTHNPYVIYTSSAAVYPPGNAPSYEFTTPEPATIYGKSKLLGEDIIKAIAKTWTILRLSNVYGNGDGNGVVDKFMRGERTIYGDGSQMRDYVAVETVVGAIEELIYFPAPGQTFNISSGVGQRVTDVFEQFGTRNPIFAPPRDFDIPYSVLDNSKATNAGLI